jgi:hypothetical protein
VFILKELGLHKSVQVLSDFEAFVPRDSANGSPARGAKEKAADDPPLS